MRAAILMVVALWATPASANWSPALTEIWNAKAYYCGQLSWMADALGGSGLKMELVFFRKAYREGAPQSHVGWLRLRWADGRRWGVAALGPNWLQSLEDNPEREDVLMVRDEFMAKSHFCGYTLP